ncbi:nucleotide exchange factor GrpE [Patescibacteria group bacterium]|nr:nucleotide exchange factor GrpE [Patescibacteria group bacterium]MBU4078418.1 nucleotide exchange factor GrpE [Patescibacteria group bacterium]
MEKQNKEKIQKDKDLKALKQEKDKYLAGWQRCQADFLNYKKAEAERLNALVDYEIEDWAHELLIVIDQLDRARQEVKEKTSVIQGFLQIEEYFINFLKSKDIKEIKTEVGKLFNPEIEEAVETEEKKGAKDGEILAIIQKGYKHKNKIIRPTRVKVAKN